MRTAVVAAAFVAAVAAFDASDLPECWVRISGYGQQETRRYTNYRCSLYVSPSTISIRKDVFAPTTRARLLIDASDPDVKLLRRIVSVVRGLEMLGRGY